MITRTPKSQNKHTLITFISKSYINSYKIYSSKNIYKIQLHFLLLIKSTQIYKQT